MKLETSTGKLGYYIQIHSQWVSISVMVFKLQLSVQSISFPESTPTCPRYNQIALTSIQGLTRVSPQCPACEVGHLRLARGAWCYHERLSDRSISSFTQTTQGSLDQGATASRDLQNPRSPSLNSASAPPYITYTLRAVFDAESCRAPSRGTLRQQPWVKARHREANRTHPEIDLYIF